MKEELKKIARELHQRLTDIKVKGYTEERLDAAISTLEVLKRKLNGDNTVSLMELDAGELVDDGTADGD